MELLWLAPTGTYKVQEMLQQGGWGCDRGGATGTFTPMWLPDKQLSHILWSHVSL